MLTIILGAANGKYTGKYHGAIAALTNIIDSNILWVLCRHHIYEVHIAHFLEVLFGGTKGPQKLLYVKFKKIWPEIFDEVNKLSNLSIFDWSTLSSSSIFYVKAKEALTYLTHALHNETFA